jgi:hypothetical protein
MAPIEQNPFYNNVSGSVTEPRQAEDSHLDTGDL